MKRIFWCFAVTAAVTFNVPRLASADAICMRSNLAVKHGIAKLGSAFNVGTSCKAGFQPLRFFEPVAGYANFDQTGKVTAFGGAGVKSISIQHVEAGLYEISFKGKFPELTAGDSTFNQNLIVFQATPALLGFTVTNGFVVSADSAKVVIGVYTFDSDNISHTVDAKGGSVFFTIGHLPTV